GGGRRVRTGNEDARFALHGVFATRGHDRHVAITAGDDDRAALARVLGLPSMGEVSRAAVAEAVAERDALEVARALQDAGVAAHPVSDAGDVAGDEHLWARGFFGLLSGREDMRPHGGPAFGGGADIRMTPGHRPGEDNRAVLRDIAGLSDAEIDAAEAVGVIGGGPSSTERPRATAAEYAVRIERGELSRVDDAFDGWTHAR
ncbi:MAG: CoA transferase, partial [Dehalococcoidia bacterium]